MVMWGTWLIGVNDTGFMRELSRKSFVTDTLSRPEESRIGWSAFHLFKASAAV
jgi:hypothetical protein